MEFSPKDRYSVLLCEYKLVRQCVPENYPALWCCRWNNSEVLLTVELNLQILWNISSVTQWGSEQHLFPAEWLCVMEMVQTGVSPISEKLTQWL